MNYSEHFKEKTDGDLLDLLSNRTLLNFEAQRCLEYEIKGRSMTVNSDALQELRDLIKSEELKIREFQYLPFLGFGIQRDQETIIKRLTSARWVDVASVVVSVAMMLAAIPLASLINVFLDEGLTGALPVVGLVVCLASVAYGVMLFLRSMERILDFWQFQILKSGGGLQINKGAHQYSLTSDLSSALQVVSNEGSTRLVLSLSENTKPVTLISTDGGLRLHLTLKHLRDYLVQ